MRDIEGKQLLREMVESDSDVVVNSGTVKVTYGSLRKIVREALSEEITVANEEMDAPDELVVQEDPLYPGDDGLEQSSHNCGCEEESYEEDMATQALEDEELAAVLAAAEMQHDSRSEGDYDHLRRYVEGSVMKEVTAFSNTRGFYGSPDPQSAVSFDKEDTFETTARDIRGRERDVIVSYSIEDATVLDVTVFDAVTGRQMMVSKSEISRLKDLAYEEAESKMQGDWEEGRSASAISRAESERYGY